MTNTLPSKNGSKRTKAAGRESAVGLQKHKRTATDIGLALITPIVGQDSWTAQPARSAQPRAAVRRQAGVLRRRRIDPPVQAHPGPRQGADPAKAERRRLLRPDPRRRPEDDRRDGQTSSPRRSCVPPRATPTTPRLPARPDRQGRRTGHHRDQHPRGFRRHRRPPRAR